MAISLGIYRHYKNQKLYEVLGTVLHSETLEEMVLYKTLYANDKFALHTLFVRPQKMFFEQVLFEGQRVPRFAYLSNDS